MNMRIRHQGGSTIGFIIFVAIFGYGVFVGLQYIPQYIESNTVNTILDNLVEKNRAAPMASVGAVESAIDNQLFINEMADLRDSFSIRQYRGDFEVTVRYERELNLLYETKVMLYEKQVTLE